MATANRGQLAQLRTLLIAIAVLAALLLLRPLAWGAASLLLMLFATVLLAVLLDSLAQYPRTYLRMPRLYALIAVVVLLVSAVAALMWTMGPRITAQVAVLIERLPESIREIGAWVEDTPWAARVLDSMPKSEEIIPRAGEIVQAIPGFFYTTMGDVVAVVFVIVTGFYLALDPGLYRRGVLALLPAGQDERWAQILDAVARALRWWLVGRLTAMLVIGLLTIAGLWLIDVPLALLLGLLAGLLSFIPLIGPIVSAIPAILIAVVSSPEKALGVVAVFAIVQFLEGNFVTPLIQKRAVSLPPAVLLAAQLLFGVPFGFVGLLLATPATVALIVIVQMVYVRDALGRTVYVLGEHAQRGTHGQQSLAK